MNKALKSGRVPSMVIAVLQAIEHAGLGEHFTVVGTHALYAYETAAGVRIVPGALATQDVDLLWDARQRIRFVSDIEKLDMSVLKILKLADPTFQRKDGQNETAINAKGFEVDFLRRQPEGDDPHPFRFSTDEDDLWPVQARRASVLLLMDEPTAGMSPEETRVMMDLITTLAAERSVILVEHKMKLVMGICERLLVLHHGEFLAEGTPDEIRANTEVRRVYLGQG